MVALALSALALASCDGCPGVQRPQSEAVDMAKAYAASAFTSGGTRPVHISDLRISAERYQHSDRSWYFHIATLDGKCTIVVAVPDCDAVESAGGGDCRDITSNDA